MVIQLTNEQAMTQLTAASERERLADLERVRLASPWNRPPHRSLVHAVAATITLFRALPVDQRDPIAGPVPVRPEDHTPVAFRILGEDGLLHRFARSAVAERCRREPRASTRAAFMHFVRGPVAEGCLNLGLRRPDSDFVEGERSCNLATWRFIGSRVNAIVRGEAGQW